MGIKNLLPAPSEIAQPDRTVVLDLSSEEADEIFGALSSTTARSVLSTLHDEPQPASQLAESLDMTLQNVNYHIQRLRDADLIEVADIWYSDTGNEMKVYAPSKKAVMVLADQPTTRRLREMVVQVFSFALLIGGAAALFRFAIVDWLTPDRVESGVPVDDTDDVATDGAEDAPDPERDDAPEAIDLDPEITVQEALEMLPLLLDPGVVFVLGAVTALIVVAIVWSIRGRHLR